MALVKFMDNLLKQLGLFILDFLETIVLSFAIFVVIYVFVTQPHKVKGDSMLPNFHSDEYLLTDKISYRLRTPARGDIIVFRYPLAPQYDYIKRIIGLPSEEIELKDGHVIIYNQDHKDGMAITEKYLRDETLTTGRSGIPDGIRIKIPDKHYVVMGDNRQQSSDSREWGTISYDNIIGRVWLRYWPPQALAFISDHKYAR